MIELSKQRPFVRIMASEKSWIEGEAVNQLNKTAGLKGVITAIGLPDLHPGSGNPVGSAFLIEGRVYPHLIGNDVGCGMGLWKTSLKSAKAKRDKWVKKLKGLESPWEGDSQPWLEDFDLPSSDHDPALGTIGGGNHFAELQVVEKILCQESFAALNLDKSHLVLLVHSGSRGIGEALFRRHAEKYGANGLLEDTEEAKHYLQQHRYAMKWASVNRALIAHRFAEQLGAICEPVLDVCHNNITAAAGDNPLAWLHRKGAVPSDQGPVVIPGSRGTLSYLVHPKGEQHLNLWSLAHGAGRKWNRKSCRERIKARFSAQALTRTELGGMVICEDKLLLYEEAPPAYKNIDSVIADLFNEGLIEIIATLKPLITYKTRQTK